jgi:hypothetical protein
MDGDGELGASMDSSLAALGESKASVMFCFVESSRGLRFARFSGEKTKALSESFFFGREGLKRKVLPIKAAEAAEAEDVDAVVVANGPCARLKRASGLGWEVDFGSRGVQGTGGANGEAAATEIVFRRHSVIVACRGTGRRGCDMDGQRRRGKKRSGRGRAEGTCQATCVCGLASHTAQLREAATTDEQGRGHTRCVYL